MSSFVFQMLTLNLRMYVRVLPVVKMATRAIVLKENACLYAMMGTTAGQTVNVATTGLSLAGRVVSSIPGNMYL